MSHDAAANTITWALYNNDLNRWTRPDPDEVPPEVWVALAKNALGVKPCAAG